MLEGEIEINCRAIYTKTNLLRTSDQIRREASTIFFGENRFVITNITDCQEHREDVFRFLERLTIREARAISSLVFRQGTPLIISEALEVWKEGQSISRPLVESNAIIAARFHLSSSADTAAMIVEIVGNAATVVERLGAYLVVVGLDAQVITTQSVDKRKGYFRGVGDKVANSVIEEIVLAFQRAVKYTGDLLQSILESRAEGCHTEIAQT